MNAHEEALQRALNQMSHIAAGNKPLYNPKESLQKVIAERQDKVIAEYGELIKAAPHPVREAQEVTPEGMAASAENFYQNSRFKD
ncbi:MAG: hypothetical protein ACRCW5_11025 [Cetobacterium sp.]|uniref:hypothetical protein n=1 Tax=Cetobacterium sp. TaxID=2071632 RepID=UPI003F353220